MTTDSRIFALIVAAGSGSRAGGDVPKQYARVGGKALLRYSIEALASHPRIAGVQVVIHREHEALYREAIAPRTTHDSRLTKLLPPVLGGAERSDSVLAGLEALAPHAPDYVLIHDAARPFLRQEMITEILTKLAPDTAIVPAIAVPDTVRRLEDGAWSDVARAGLMRIQTPQAFAFETLKKIYATGAASTDDAAIWLAAGLKLAYVPGDEELRKVTNADDLCWAEQKAQQKNAPTRSVVGMGFDVHALMPAGENHVIRLGGIDIAHDHKLHGHSDADVVLHAIVDALLGTIGAGDIGTHFPPSDARWKGADSATFIEEARAQVAARGGVISHLDVTIIGERPHIAPHRDAMRARIAALLKLPITRVSVKATTTEKLGFTGRGEGIAAQAVATVSLPEDA